MEYQSDTPDTSLDTSPDTSPDADRREEWHELLLALVKRYHSAPGALAPGSAVSGHAAPGHPAGAPREELHREVNRSCGDTVVVYCSDSDHGAVPGLDIRGCAICKASGAIAEIAVQSLSRTDALALCTEMIRCLSGAGEAERPDIPAGIAPDVARDLAVLAVVRTVPGRRSCALLPWEALMHVLGEQV